MPCPSMSSSPGTQEAGRGRGNSHYLCLLKADKRVGGGGVHGPVEHTAGRLWSWSPTPSREAAQEDLGFC